MLKHHTGQMYGRGGKTFSVTFSFSLSLELRAVWPRAYHFPGFWLLFVGIDRIVLIRVWPVARPLPLQDPLHHLPPPKIAPPHTHAHARARAHTHTRTHAHTHTRTHAHTRARARVCMGGFFLQVLLPLKHWQGNQSLWSNKCSLHIGWKAAKLQTSIIVKQPAWLPC